jgi:hypothetical protein
MDPFRLCLAFGPVAAYLVLLGVVNLRRRPALISGTRDTFVLGLAVTGLVTIGPIELFFPTTAAALFGAYTWAFLYSLYGLCLVLVVLTTQPRLVIYNISADQLRPILAEVVEGIDAQGRWAGDSLVLPSLGVQLHLDNSPVWRNVSLVASGPHQNYLGWRKLQLALAPALGKFKVRRNWRCLSLLAAGAIVTAVLATMVAADPQQVAQSMRDMLRP